MKQIYVCLLPVQNKQSLLETYDKTRNSLYFLPHAEQIWICWNLCTDSSSQIKEGNESNTIQIWLSPQKITDILEGQLK